MFDCYQAGEQAVLVHIDFPDDNAREDLQEFEMLVSSAVFLRLQLLRVNEISHILNILLVVVRLRKYRKRFVYLRLMLFYLIIHYLLHKKKILKLYVNVG